MTALTVNHHIAAPLEVLDAALGLRAQNLAQALTVLDVVDAGSFEAGNRMLLEAHQALKDLEASRVKLKKPITELGREIDKVVSKVADPLDAAKRRMQGLVAGYQRAEQAKADAARREAEEKARQEREAAERERARLQAEADAKAKEEAEEMARILGAPVEPEKVTVAAPVVPVAAPAPIPEAPKASAVQVRKVQRVEFDDRAQVPIHVGGAILRPIDEAAVLRALKAGATIPGARLVEVETYAAGRA